ncbi:MAG: phycobilisome linker polypeptide, partial [Prochlorotrichaceae cyanobacterium]
MYNANVASGASNTPSNSRLFVYEVQGLRQPPESDKYQIRRSGSQYLLVPYSRMSQEMQRIHRLGGKIVNIVPYNSEDGGADQSQMVTVASVASTPIANVA